MSPDDIENICEDSIGSADIESISEDSVVGSGDVESVSGDSVVGSGDVESISGDSMGSADVESISGDSVMGSGDVESVSGDSVVGSGDVESVSGDSIESVDANPDVNEANNDSNQSNTLPNALKHDVFISYSTKNSDVANKIRHVLEANNLKCWIAPRNISSGKNYIDEIADGIKSTKIVVLVYSSYSQASKYVNNEINMAFSNNKPILSFNIDNSMPSEDMGYYLKVSQWLPAFPNPEDEFETLIIDSLKLCHESTDVPIVIDFTNYKEEDLSKHKKDIVSLVLLFTPLYWASFIYMGIVANKKLWTLMGLVYLVPTLMCLIIYFQVLRMLFLMYPMLKLFSVMFILFWILAIIHGLLIRNEFLTRKSVLRFTILDENVFEYLYDEYLEL